MKRILLPLFLLASIVLAVLAGDASAQLLRRNRSAAPATPSFTTPAPELVPAAAPTAPPAANPITDGHRLLYSMARNRAVGELARKKNISRADARQMIEDEAPDELLHMMSKAAGLKFKGLPTAGGFQGFLDWLLSHSDQIAALIKLILSLFGV